MHMDIANGRTDARVPSARSSAAISEVFGQTTTTPQESARGRRVLSAEMPQPYFLPVGSAGCLPLPSV
eukprot:1771176-Amphidinium_carterae.1